MGHLEAAAAVAGSTSLFLFPLKLMLHSPCCSLRRINSHLESLELDFFYFLVEVAPGMSKLAQGRLSSFGYSGTIAHGLFAATP